MLRNSVLRSMYIVLFVFWIPSKYSDHGYFEDDIFFSPGVLHIYP